MQTNLICMLPNPICNDSMCGVTVSKSPSRCPQSYILNLSDHPDGDQKSWKHFLSTPMDQIIPKRYHMWEFTMSKFPIKMSKVIQIPSVLDILDLPDHPNGDQKSWKHFIITPMVFKDSKKGNHMWCYNDKIPIKMPQNPK